MDLKAAVARYLEVTGEFGRPMPLVRFGLSGDQLETMVSAWDEDYHLHRHFKLIAAPSPGDPTQDPAYLINEMPCTAIVFYESIQDALA